MLLGMPHGQSKRASQFSSSKRQAGATGLDVRHGAPAGYEDLLVTVKVFIDLYYHVLVDPGRSFAIKACR
jgi:hypothetical protein